MAFVPFREGAFHGEMHADFVEPIRQWLRNSSLAIRLKENSARVLWKLPLKEYALFIKQFKQRGFLQNLRFALLPSKARDEFRVLKVLTEKGIPVPPPIGFLEEGKSVWYSTSYVITKEIPDVQSVREYLAQNTLNRSELQFLLRAIANVLHQLYAAGLWHQDLHLGNILLGADKKRLYVLDVHRAKLYERIEETKRIRALGFFLHSLYTFVSKADFIRFLTYFQACETLSRSPLASKQWISRVEQEFLAVRADYYRGRVKRCFMHGGGFEILNRGNGDTLFLREGVQPQNVLKIIERVERTAPLKALPQRTLSRQDGFFVKTFFGYSLKRWLENFIKGSPGGRSWKNAYAFEVRHLPTPRCIALYETRTRSFLVGEWVENALPLNDFIKVNWHTLTFAQRRTFLWDFALLVRRMHLRGVYHGDLKANNVLVQQQGDATEFYVLDLDRVRLTKVASFAQRIKNLAQLNASVTPPLTRAERLHFFCAYAARDGAVLHNKKAWLRAIMERTRQRRHLWP